MITGRFGDTSGASYLEGWLTLPGQGIGAEVSLLVDTGADSTTLMPMDGKNLGIDYSRLTCMDEATGVGGTTPTYLEFALLTFLDDGRQRLSTYAVTLDILPPNPDLDGLPSLLGRDILDRWRMVCDRTHDKITFTVRSADVSEPL